MATKFGRLVDYKIKPQSTKSHVLLITYISTSVRPVNTKLDRVMTYENGSPPTMAT